MARTTDKLQDAIARAGAMREQTRRDAETAGLQTEAVDESIQRLDAAITQARRRQQELDRMAACAAIELQILERLCTAEVVMIKAIKAQQTGSKRFLISQSTYLLLEVLSAIQQLPNRRPMYLPCDHLWKLRRLMRQLKRNRHTGEDEQGVLIASQFVETLPRVLGCLRSH